MKRGLTNAPPLPAWQAAPFDHLDQQALQALAEGKANEDQQRRFLDWFIRATGVKSNPYRPGADGARDTDFACGKRFVGDQFVGIIAARGVAER